MNMELIKQIDKHEMLRRWAISEVYVDLLNDFDSFELEETLFMLLGKDPEKEEEGIKRALKTHHISLVDCLPDDVTWYLALLKINQQEFNLLRSLPVPDLGRVTNNTYKIPYGARIINQKRSLNLRISSIMKNFRKGKQHVQLSGITLLGKGVEGPFTIIEGNGRLISLYQVLFNEQRSISFHNNKLEVVLGLSDKDL